MGARVADLTWQQVRDLLHSGATAVLPVGAGAKEHGQHMLMGTDLKQADWLGEQLARRDDVLVWPTLPYGHYPAFVPYAGSCSLSAATFEAVLTELIEGLLHTGAQRVLVLNTGISTIPPIERAAAASGHPQRVILAHVYRGSGYLQCLRGIREQSGQGTHADEAETSIMMHIDPASVDQAAARRCVFNKRPGPFQPDDPQAENYSPTGTWGDPTVATRGKGDRLVEAILSDLGKVL